MRQKPFLKLLTEAGPLIALTVALALLVGIVGPASAQFFNFGGPPQRSAPRGGGGWFGGGWFGGGGGDFFAPFRPAPEPAPKRVYQDFSKAPPPEKRDTVPERNVLVLGDAMADWLAYGLEDAYAEQPDIGVIRKIKTVSGLIQYQPKGAPADWAAAAKDILAAEKPDVIVMMLGLNDRIPLREPATEKTDKQPEKKNDKTARKPDNKPADAKPPNKDAADTAAKPDEKAADSELPQDDAANADTPPERAPRSPNGIYQFRDERWVELYNKKIDEMVAVLKSKGVPVVWVGLPAVRGPKGTADTLFLDSLYRDAAGKAGITYVDVWDGFVDEAGRYLQKGPDFEGQIRQLRSYDGVYFTKYGSRKLAHYVEREITRLLAARSGPVALPTEPATPDTNAAPGQPAPRPLAGPIVPLVAASVNSDQLLGGPGSRPAAVDALAARTLVKGEPLTPPPGRADDFLWPRREVGHEPAKEPAKGDAPVAATTPAAPAVTPAAPAGTAGDSPHAAPNSQQKQAKPAQQPQQQQRPAQPHEPSFGDFFGFGGAPKQQAPAKPPAAPGAPRPPANVGHSAAVQ
ncbi:DUF459 domain-containing protein [Bradyrhizobium sp. STM 3562]|uniref:DUF459 domain-containing protein n=1 Tax=Bradyrhizobium sp. STM 3562 TaxID=578924 RepID=UPI00388E590E